VNIMLINGPNLNLLGIREPKIYGYETLDEIMTFIKNSPEGFSHKFKFFQTNHEGKIIDILHEQIKWANGILINPGALTHYSYAIRDAISALGIPTVEVHLSNIKNREEFRKISVIEPVCIKQISGLGKNSYIEGIKVLNEINE